MYAKLRQAVSLRCWLGAATFLVALGCDPKTEAADDTDGRGGIGKADLVGSCEPTDCGGPALNGNCWCDDACESWGDCCSNVEAQCSPGPATTSTTGDETGMEPAEGECRSGADCSAGGLGGGGFLLCFDADDPVCGTCFGGGPDSCDDDNPCSGEQVCEEIFVACGCAGPFVRVCSAPCSVGDECGPDKECNPDSNTCEWARCEDTGCGPLHSCQSDAPGTGCVRLTCDSDADCGGALCVNNECHDNFGVCAPPPA